MKLDWRILGMCLCASLLVAVSLLALHAPHTLSLLLLAIGALIAPLLLWHVHKPQTLDAQTRECIQRVLDAVPQPLYIKTADARFLWVNQAFAQERLRSPEALLQMSSFDLAPSEDMAQLIAAEDRAVMSGDSIDKEQRSTVPDSNKERIRIVSKRLCKAPNGEQWIVGAHFDITSLRQVEGRLQEAMSRETRLRENVQAYMQRLIDVIPQPVYVKDAHSRFVLVNDSFVNERLLSRAEIIGHSPLDLSKNPNHARDVISEDLQVVAGRAIYKEEHAQQPVTGEERFRRITKVACQNEVGEPVIVGANFDITLWRQADRALRDSLAHLQSLANMLPMPLCVIDGACNEQLKVRLANLAFTNLLTDYAEVLSASLATALSSDAKPVLTLPNSSQGTTRRFKLQISKGEESTLCILTEEPVNAA